MNYLARSQFDDRNEREFLIEIGILETKVGDPSEFRPSKIIKTPANVFLNEEFLSNDYFNLFNQKSTQLDLKIEEFLTNLFFNEILENSEGADVYLIINLFVPSHIIDCLQETLLKKLKVRSVGIIPSQICALYTSVLETGILIDFSFTNIAFIPFYKGFVLQKFVRKSAKSGVSLFKKLHDSVRTFNSRYDEKDFNTKMEMLSQTMVECISILTREEHNILRVNFEQDKDKMRGKIITNSTPLGNVHVSFMENYKIANHFFEDELNIAMEFLEFLREIPSNLQLVLVKNIIPTGGLVLLNNFLVRFKDEVVQLILNDDDFKKNFNCGLENSFNFAYSNYMSNLLHFAGGWIKSVGILEDFKTRT